MPPRPDRASPLRVGLVGTGFVARGAHLPAWAQIPGARVTALCDIDSGSLERAAPLAPGAACFTDRSAFLESGVDIVDVCCSNAAHFPVALAALEAGKHVLCEKPLGISVAEIRALGAAADARGLTLMAHHQLRFAGPALAAQACLDAGRPGAVHHARVRALRRDRAPTLPGFTDLGLSGGGAVLDLGVHALDIALRGMGFPKPVRVSGSVRSHFAHSDRIAGHWGPWDRSRFTVEDSGIGLVRFENGATLSLECAWLGHYGEEGMDCEWYGEAGNLIWPSGEFVSQGPVLRRENLILSDTEEAHLAAIRAFYTAVAEGKPSPVPWTESAVSLSIIEGLYASARSGREVEIP